MKGSEDGNKGRQGDGERDGNEVRRREVKEENRGDE